MAIWQFEVALVPAGTEALVRTNRGYEMAPLPERAVAAMRPILDAGLGRPCLDEGETVSYGSLNGNRVNLIHNGAASYEIWMGIDARSDADYFCTLICAMARALDCDLFSPEFEVRFAPDRQALVQALMNSRAWIFALDPSQFKETAYGWMHL